MKHFFAISAYDKFTEVRVLVDILRENWSGDYGIVVYSSHPDAQKELAELKVDALITEDSYSYSPGDGEHILTARIFDSMRLLFEKAIELGANSVTHLHSDSWPLKEESFLRLLARLTDKPILARGAGLGERGFLAPLGVISDMFLIFSASWLRESGFLKARASDCPLDILNIHGLLSVLMFSNGGFGALDFYDDYQDQEIVPELAKLMPCSLPSYPSIFNREWDLLHVHTGCFPDELGRKVQAAYLQKLDLCKGESLQEFTKGVVAEEVFAEVRERFKQSDKRLKAFRLKAVDFSQDLVVMEELAASPAFNLWRMALKIKFTHGMKDFVASRFLKQESPSFGGFFRLSRSLVFEESVDSYYSSSRKNLLAFEAAAIKAKKK